MTQSQSIGAIAQALVAAHAEMPAVPFDATNPFLHNNFASLGAVINVVRPILAKHSLAIMQFATSDEQGRPGVRTRLVHSSGEFMEDTICLEVGEEKGKSKAQVAGSIITYLRRYAQSALLNLYADADTDGAAPAANSGAPKPVSEANKPSVHRAAANAVVATAKAQPATLADKCKARFLSIIKEKKLDVFAWLWAVANGWILDTEQLKDARADKFPTTAEEADSILEEIRADAGGEVTQAEAEAYDAAHLPADAPAQVHSHEPWMDVVLPFGKEKGKKLGELPRNYLFGMAKNYEPKPYKGQISDKDKALRKALDNALSYLDQHKDYGPAGAGQDANAPF